MKNKKILLITILFITIGFALTATTLFINGDVRIASLDEDFDIYFSSAVLDDIDKSNLLILSDKKTITFETRKLKEVGDSSVLEFEVTNNSTQYDANVYIECANNYTEYTEIVTSEDEFSIEAQTRKSGTLTVSLIKNSDNFIDATFTCSIKANAISRESIKDVVIMDTTYQVLGTLLDDEGNPLINKNLVVYSETPHYVLTDDYGFFYVGGLEKGEHEIYYIGDELGENKSKDEIKDLSTDVAIVSTNKTDVVFKNDITLSESIIEVQNTPNINVDLDAQGGTIAENNYVIPKYKRISDLEIPQRSSNYVFLGWYSNGKRITDNTIIRDDMELVAMWEQICNLEPGTSWEFNYTGNIQEFHAPCDGTYTVELYGAQGGSSYARSSGYVAAPGGYYVLGERTLFYDNNYYVVVGGMGGTNTAGGYNGGGSGGTFSNGSVYLNTGSGGGATDLRKDGTELSDRIMVAAGGPGQGGDVYQQSTATCGIDAYGMALSSSLSNSNNVLLTGTNSGYDHNGRNGAGILVNYYYGGGGGGYYGGTIGYAGTNYGGETETAGSRTGNGYAKITFVSAE